VRDINLRGAKDYQIASYARTNGLCILTGDFDFSDVRNYLPSQYAGLVVLKLPKNATASLIIKIGVNMKRVWRVIKIDLPDLKSKISRIWEDIS
jgi:predicted nuclease of predicted toxin-antitoxin system